MAKPSKVNKWLTPNKLLLIESWATHGLTMEQIAHNMNVAPSTLYEYKNKYPEIDEAIENGRDVKVAILENKLFKSACGYKIEDVYVDNEGKAKKHIRELPSSDTACIFLLKHTRPDIYSEKQVNNKESEDHLDKVLNEIKGNI